MVLVFPPTATSQFWPTSSQMVLLGEYWMIYRRPGFLAFVWFGSSPTPSPLPSASRISFSVFLCVADSPVELTDGRGGGGGGGAKLHDSEKALSTIYHSILSGTRTCLAPLSKISFLPTSFTILKYEVHSILSILNYNLSIPSRIWSIRYSCNKRYRNILYPFQPAMGSIGSIHPRMVIIHPGMSLPPLNMKYKKEAKSILI